MTKVGIVGIGRMGIVHLTNIIKGRVKGAKLVAIADIDNAVREDISKKYPSLSVFSTHKEMLNSEKLDAVIVATPHYSHEEIVIDTLNAGVNVLTEKPICVTTKSAKNMINIANQHKDLLFTIMYNQRTNRMYAKAKQLVDNNAIGKITRANLIITDWYRSQAYYNQGGWRASYNGEGGGVLINQCVHQLDITQWILGVPKSVIAINKTIGRDITVENDVTSILRYDDFELVFTASTHELNGTNRLEIAGEKGKIIVEKHKMTYYLHNKSEPEINMGTTDGYGIAKSKKYKLSYGLFRLIKDSIRGQQVRILNNFVQAIQGKEQLLSNGREGLNALSIINAIYLSGWLDKEVTLPIDDDLYEVELSKKKELELNKGEK